MPSDGDAEFMRDLAQRFERLAAMWPELADHAPRMRVIADCLATRAIPVGERLLNDIAGAIEGDGKPGEGGIDITGGIPSEVYVAIGRERYDDEYEVAKDTADSVRTSIARYLRSESARAKFLPPPST